MKSVVSKLIIDDPDTGLKRKATVVNVNWNVEQGTIFMQMRIDSLNLKGEAIPMMQRMVDTMANSNEVTADEKPQPTDSAALVQTFAIAIDNAKVLENLFNNYLIKEKLVK